MFINACSSISSFCGPYPERMSDFRDLIIPLIEDLANEGEESSHSQDKSFLWEFDSDVQMNEGEKTGVTKEGLTMENPNPDFENWDFHSGKPDDTQ